MGVGYQPSGRMRYIPYDEVKAGQHGFPPRIYGITPGQLAREELVANRIYYQDLYLRLERSTLLLDLLF